MGALRGFCSKKLPTDLGNINVDDLSDAEVKAMLEDNIKWLREKDLHHLYMPQPDKDPNDPLVALQREPVVTGADEIRHLASRMLEEYRADALNSDMYLKLDDAERIHRMKEANVEEGAYDQEEAKAEQQQKIEEEAEERGDPYTYPGLAETPTPIDQLEFWPKPPEEPQARKKACYFCYTHKKFTYWEQPLFDPMNVALLAQFMSNNGRILPRKATGSCAKHQRRISKVIKKSRHMGFFSHKRSQFSMNPPFLLKHSLMDDEISRAKELTQDIDPDIQAAQKRQSKKTETEGDLEENVGTDFLMKNAYDSELHDEAFDPEFDEPPRLKSVEKKMQLKVKGTRPAAK